MPVGSKGKYLYLEKENILKFKEMDNKICINNKLNEKFIKRLSLTLFE